MEKTNMSKKEQAQEEMQQNIRRASNEKILRRQIEMLTEYSRTCGVDRAPEANEAIALLYRSLIETKCIFFVRVFVALLGFCYLIKRLSIKGVQFIKR